MPFTRASILEHAKASETEQPKTLYSMLELDRNA